MFILGDSKLEVEGALTNLDNILKPLGINISIKKTKTLQLSPAKESERTYKIKIGGQELEEVDHFCYLGQQIASDSSLSKEISNRISSARSKLRLLAPVLSSNISRATKKKLIEKNVMPSLLYGAETWSTTANDESRLDAFMNLCRLKILNKMRFDKLTVGELHNDVLFPHVQTMLAVKRLCFYASLNKQCTSQLAKDMLFAQLESGRKVGARVKREWSARLTGDVEWLYSSSATASHILKDIRNDSQNNGSSAVSQLRIKLKGLAATKKDCTLHRAPRLLGERIRDVQCEHKNCVHLFAEKKEMLRHMRRDHTSNENEIIEIPVGKKYIYTVAGCKASFKTLGWRTRHLKNSHNLPLANSDKNTANPSVTLDKPDEAGGLDTASTVSTAALSHALVLPKTPPWACPFPNCNKVYGSKKTLENHGDRVHDWSLRNGAPKRARVRKCDPINTPILGAGRVG